jgi:hypothetical protein
VTFVVDEEGIIRARFSDEGYATRRTAASILALRGEDVAAAQEIRAEHVQVRTHLSNTSAFPGNLITLVLEVEFDKGLHAYAPGTEGYRALALSLEPQSLLSYGETVYPPSHPYLFRPLKETVAVFEGRIRLSRDVRLAVGPDVGEFLKSPDPVLAIRGRLDYQACSDRVCYPPRTLPLTWTLKVRPLERERPPESLQRRMH